MQPQRFLETCLNHGKFVFPGLKGDFGELLSEGDRGIIGVKFGNSSDFFESQSGIFRGHGKVGKDIGRYYATVELTMGLMTLFTREG